MCREFQKRSCSSCNWQFVPSLFTHGSSGTFVVLALPSVAISCGLARKASMMGFSTRCPRVGMEIIFPNRFSVYNVVRFPNISYFPNRKIPTLLCATSSQRKEVTQRKSHLFSICFQNFGILKGARFCRVNLPYIMVFPKTNTWIPKIGLNKVTPSKIWPFLVSVLNFWRVSTGVLPEQLGSLRGCHEGSNL